MSLFPNTERNQRTFALAFDSGSQVNGNRVFPGKEKGNTVQQWAYEVWNGLFLPNADAAIDLHTQTRGTAYPMFVFADWYVVEWLGSKLVLLQTCIGQNDRCPFAYMKAQSCILVHTCTCMEQLLGTFMYLHAPPGTKIMSMQAPSWTNVSSCT